MLNKPKEWFKKIISKFESEPCEIGAGKILNMDTGEEIDPSLLPESLLGPNDIYKESAEKFL